MYEEATKDAVCWQREGQDRGIGEKGLGARLADGNLRSSQDAPRQRYSVPLDGLG